MLDDDQDGWPDLFVANDTQPNKLYRNQRTARFKEVAVGAVSRSAPTARRARAWASMPAMLDESNQSTAGDHELRQRDDRPLSSAGRGLYEDVAMRAGIGARRATTLGFGCALPTRSRRRARSRRRQRHIDETVRQIRGHVGYAQAPHLFLNQGNGVFRDCGGRGRRLRKAESRAWTRRRRLRS
jgi:hypothetical protein